jgi:chromosome segregation ATPase
MGDDPVINLYDSLPSWSNDENRRLHAQILQKTSELSGLKSDCAELQDRVGVLREHLKSVQSEVSTTQQLLTAKQSQAEQEKHLQQLCEREDGKIRSDMGRLDAQAQDVAAKADVVQSKIQISQHRIERFKEENRMNQQELEQWIVIARQKEEDFLVLQRYHREDEGRVRSMLLEIEKATAIIEAKKAELEQEITQTRALQIELDMTAEQFRKMHNERAQLLAQWESTLKQIQTLNTAIETTTQGFEARKAEVEKLHSTVAEETKNLDLAQSATQKIERQLMIGDHQVSQKHRIFEKETAELAEFAETVETQRHALEKLEADARFYQSEIDNYRRMAAQENAKTEQFLQRLQETQAALGAQRDQTGDLNDQTNVMNDFLKKEEAQLKALEQAIDGEKNQIFKLSQDVYKARKAEKNLLAEIQGSQTRAKNLALKIQEFDRETQKQMELLYNSNFQIQQMERKIARIEGERTEEEKIELQSQIDQLTKILEGKLELGKILSQQLHRLELDLRQTARRKESLEKTKSDLSVKLNELHLDQDSLDKSTVKARTQKEGVLVQLNMLRLQVEKLSEQVATKSDELISLENRRQQLQLSMEERILEIDGHLAALRTQLKTEEEARHLAAVELQERKRRADTLQSKYEVMMGKYKVDGQEVSQTYHVIRFAQEREDVSRRGDELEAEVKQAIHELRVVEKEMQRMNGQNADFRSSFTSVDANDHDMERKRVLEEQVRVAQQRLNARRAEAKSVADERAAMDQTYEQQQAKITQMQEEIAKMKPVLERMAVENRDLNEKIKRASHMLAKAKDSHRKALNVPPDAKYPATLLEMDIELRMTKSTVEAAVAELTKLAEANRDIEPRLRLGITQIGLSMRQLGPTLAQPKSPPIITPQTSGRSSGSTRSSGSGGSRGSTRSTGSKGPVPSVQNLQFPK